MDQIVTIKTYTYPQEVYIIRSKLESEGIQTFLKDENLVQVHNFYSNAIGGVKLQVFKKDAERALSIIKRAEKIGDDTVIIPAKDVEDETSCPFCKSANIKPVKKAYSLVNSLHQQVGYCFDCDKSWRIKK